MSVIAYDGRYVVADTYMGGSHAGQGGMFRKIAAFEKPGRKNSLVVLGVTGAASDFFPCLDWFLGGQKHVCPISDEANLTIIYPGKRVQLFDGHDGPIYYNTPYADGAGSQHAEAAMDMGANAIKAVEVACKFVNACQPPIEAFDLVTKTWVQWAGDRIATYEGIQEVAKKNKWKAL